MRGVDAVAGGTGIGRGPAREILGVADLARYETPAGGVRRGQLGAQAVDGRVGKPGRGLVMAPRRQAGWDAAPHLEKGDFMAPGAGINSSHGRPAVREDPAGRVEVPVVLGRA